MKKNIFSFILLIILLSCKGQSSRFDRACVYKGGTRDYLDKIGCKNDYNYLKGKSLTEKFGQVASVKIVYQLKEGKVYFTNSSLYPFHYNFCTEVLHNPDELGSFNIKNYSSNPLREYILANLNYYSWLDVYGLELMPEDDTKAEELNKLYKKVAALTAFADKIKVLAFSPEMEKRLAAIPSIPVITSNEVYKGRHFIALQQGKTFGYLRKIEVKEMEKTSITKTDIVVLNGLPNNLPVVGGVLTVPFQTPLCHISLLCQNRGTPNATYTKAWADSLLQEMENKLVCYEVKADTFLIRQASEAEAKSFWNKAKSRKPIQLQLDVTTKGLVNLANAGFKNVRLIGGKAANFAELMKIRVDKKPIPLPEGAFAIPFYYYYQHVTSNGIDKLLEALLNDQAALTDAKQLNKRLKQIRDAIKSAPLNKELVEIVTARMQRNGNEFTNYRFRSSTNAEDVKGFNGAGLYDSKTGSLTDTAKAIDKAIKGVWASLWDERAFAERQYFKIDQRSVAMGILVHRAFGEELANGVAVTKHLYRKKYPAYTFNAQIGEISVVTPPDSVSSDEGIIGLGRATGSNKISVEYLGRSNLSNGKTVLTLAQIELLTKYLTAIKEHFFYKVEKGMAKDIESYWDYGMDVEFKIDTHTGRLYIKQARPLE
jgi:pyruvate, water dikinase